MALGSGKYTYELTPNWAKVPEGWDLVQVTDVAVDSRDRVYMFNRGIHPVVIFDRDGSFITSWGESPLFGDGYFKHPHGIYMGPGDTVYLSDDNTHQVFKFTRDGKLLQKWGEKFSPGVAFYHRPFNMPTGIALNPAGEMFVSDGYGNHSIHKYDTKGEHVLTWGEYGTGPGQFFLVHNVGVDSRSRVYVCDREANRVQIFDGAGKFITQWTDVNMPGDLFIRKEGRSEIVYLTEMGGKKGPCRVGVWNTSGECLSRWDGASGEGKDSIKSPHGIWVDSHGAIYVAELNPARVQKFKKVG